MKSSIDKEKLDSTSEGKDDVCAEGVRESKCPFMNRPKIIKLNRLEEFCAVLVWNA